MELPFLIHISSKPFLLSSENFKARRRQFIFKIILFSSPFILNSQSAYDQAELYFANECFDKAKPIFENYLQENPSDTKTREYLGDISAYSKDWDGAMGHYKILVEENPFHAEYRFKYGASMGMKAASSSRLRAVPYVWAIKRELEMAAQLDRNHIETRWALIEYYIQLPKVMGGSEEKAWEYAVQLSKISKVDGYLAKGHIAENLEQFQKAEHNYKMAIEVGGSPHTYEKLMKLYEKSNKPMKAIKTAAKSLKLHKRNRLNYQIGKICAQYNLDPDYGIERLEEYLANFSSDDGVPQEWAFYRMAQIYKNIGEKEIALTWINKALHGKGDLKEALEEKTLILSL